MFKKLLSALKGNKNKTSANTLAEQSNSGASPTADEELIVAYDAHGREMRIARGEWREKIFLPSLQQKWGNAQELHDAIIIGLNDGFAVDLLPAAERLVEIDDIAERSHVIHGIVLMHNEQLAAAESTLRQGIAKVGATGILLTNLAKVFSARGDEVLADETLWQAIQADPNQENGLLWWASIQREREGETGYLAALHKAGSLPGSWRAQLWLARHHLEQQDVAAARALYAEVLAEGRVDGDVLMMISGDLGNNGEIPLILKLIAPLYNEHQHGPLAGMNLLRAYQALNQPEEGEKLLERLYGLSFAPIKQHLDQFAQTFREMDRGVSQSTPVDPDTLEISTLQLTQIIWHYGLCMADWLLQPKPQQAQQVGFFAFTKIAHDTTHAQSQREDDIGRLARALPLYFAEATHYWSEFATSCYFQVVVGGGPILSGAEVDANQLFDIIPQEMKYFVTGEIGCTGEGEQRHWQLTLNLWDCTQRVKLAAESEDFAESELGEKVLQLEHRLLARIGEQRQQPWDHFYSRPSSKAMSIYLSELGQTFMLTLAANEQIPRDSIWGERAMLDWPLNMALQWPQAEVPKLMYFSGLGKAFDYKSEVLVEYKARTLEVLRQAEAENLPAARLAPLVWKIFGMTEEFETHQRNLPADTSESYLAWLDRVQEK